MGLLLAMVLTADPAGWSAHEGRDGVSLESRPVEGSSYREYRAQTDADLSPAALCDEVFDWGSKSKEHPQLTDRKLLQEDGPDRRLVYDQLDPPVVSKRDLVFWVARQRADDGSCRIDFRSTQDQAPALRDGWVRIEKLKGSWEFQPGEKGTHVTYTLFTDAAGAIPALFVHGSQREAVVESLKAGIARARAPQHKLGVQQAPGGASR